MEMWLEKTGGSEAWAFVFFTLEMKLSPANLAFRKSLIPTPGRSLCFFLSFWKCKIQILLRKLFWKKEKEKKKELLNYLLQYFFLAGNVIESQAIAAMIYEQLLEDDKPTMWKRRVLGIMKTLRTHSAASLPVCVLYLWTAALAWTAWRFILLTAGTQASSASPQAQGPRAGTDNAVSHLAEPRENVRLEPCFYYIVLPMHCSNTVLIRYRCINALWHRRYWSIRAQRLMWEVFSRSVETSSMVQKKGIPRGKPTHHRATALSRRPKLVVWEECWELIIKSK